MSQAKEARKEERKQRIPFGARRLKLEVGGKIPGYVLRWIDDKPGRIQAALDGGYEYVTRKEAQEHGLSVGQGAIHEGNSDLNDKVSKVTWKSQGGIRGFLMKIKQEWYDEDQLSKEQVNLRVDESIRMGSPGGNVVENQYVPKGHKQQI